ncbi:MAG: hypothetical protein JXA08_09155 [Methanomicrobiaceae archaeon]|nr:hypothetical protein [Methanomicrobiaceae archaeon]
MATRIHNAVLLTLSGSSRQSIQFLMLIVVFFVGGQLVLAGSMSIGDFVAFAAYIAMFSASVTTFFTFPVIIQPALTSVERLREIFATAAETTADSADAATHEWVRGVEGSFAAACRAVRRCADAGLHPQVIMTVMERNQGQMADLITLAGELGAGSVKFNLLQPTERGAALHRAGGAIPVAEAIRLAAWVEGEGAAMSGCRLIFGIPPAFRPLHRLLGCDDGGCGICGIHSILGLLPDGSYALCGIGEHIPDLIFGQAGTDSLADVWKTSPVLRDLRDRLPSALSGICGDCLMNGICLGSCIAQNYYRTGDLFAPFWFCEEADREGLFPAGRRRPAP